MCNLVHIQINVNTWWNMFFTPRMFLGWSTLFFCAFEGEWWSFVTSQASFCASVIVNDLEERSNKAFSYSVQPTSTHSLPWGSQGLRHLWESRLEWQQMGFGQGLSDLPVNHGSPATMPCLSGKPMKCNAFRETYEASRSVCTSRKKYSGPKHKNQTKNSNKHNPQQNQKYPKQRQN